MRLYYSIKLMQTGDASCYIAFVGMYGVTENSIGVLCTCLPVFPRFFKVVGPKLVSFYKSGATITSQLKANVRTDPSHNNNKNNKNRARFLSLGDTQEEIFTHGTKTAISSPTMELENLDRLVLDDAIYVERKIVWT